MRPLYALAAAAGILGVVLCYMKFQAAVARPPAIASEQKAPGKFDVELTLTFDAGADAFSLGGESLVVSFRGKNLYESRDPLAAGAPLVIRDVAGVVAGPNEFFVKATPAEPAVGDEFDLESSGPAPAVSRAVRVRILRDGLPIGDRTLWSEPGQPVEGVVAVDVPSDPTEPAMSAVGIGEHEHEAQ